MHSSVLQREDSSLTHSECLPSNQDEPEPLSKQLLSDSVRLKQAPGVTEFSHLPKEINKRAVRPCEHVPPSSNTVRTFRRNPGEDVLGSDTQDFLKPSLQEAAQKTLPLGIAPVRGRVAPRTLPSLTCTLPSRYLASLHLFPHLSDRNTYLTTLLTEAKEQVGAIWPSDCLKEVLNPVVLQPLAHLSGELG